MQFFDDSGARREVVGVLERVDMRGSEPVLLVRAKDDALVTVPLARIRAGRVVGPRT